MKFPMPYAQTIDSEFAIVGGGVAGLAMAIAFQQPNRDFILFEQATERKGIGAGFGLAAHAMRALDLLGLRSEVEQIGYYLNNHHLFVAHGQLLVAPATLAI